MKWIVTLVQKSVYVKEGKRARPSACRSCPRCKGWWRQHRNTVSTLVTRGGSARSFHVGGTTIGAPTSCACSEISGRARSRSLSIADGARKRNRPSTPPKRRFGNISEELRRDYCGLVLSEVATRVVSRFRTQLAKNAVQLNFTLPSAMRKRPSDPFILMTPSDKQATSSSRGLKSGVASAG